MKSTALALLLFAAVSSPACAQTNAKTQNPNPQPSRITIDATELDSSDTAPASSLS